MISEGTACLRCVVACQVLQTTKPCKWDVPLESIHISSFTHQNLFLLNKIWNCDNIRSDGIHTVGGLLPALAIPVATVVSCEDHGCFLCEPRLFLVRNMALLFILRFCVLNLLLAYHKFGNRFRSIPMPQFVAIPVAHISVYRIEPRAKHWSIIYDDECFIELG